MDNVGGGKRDRDYRKSTTSPKSLKDKCLLLILEEVQVDGNFWAWEAELGWSKPSQ